MKQIDYKKESIIEFINRKTKKKFKTNDVALRSCWNCNGCHKHLKKVNYPIFCFSCGRVYYKGGVLK